MANKLIATEFVYYVYDDHAYCERRYTGSYLGRKVASVRTLRAFLRETIKSTGVPWRLRGVIPRGNYVSQWIAK
jgi:hypothetical protein